MNTSYPLKENLPPEIRKAIYDKSISLIDSAYKEARVDDFIKLSEFLMRNLDKLSFYTREPVKHIHLGEGCKTFKEACDAALAISPKDAYDFLSD